jgi:hypothetical protein
MGQRPPRRRVEPPETPTCEEQDIPRAAWCDRCNVIEALRLHEQVSRGERGLSRIAFSPYNIKTLKGRS